MAFYSFTQKQFLPISIEKAWDFFSNPSNLSLLTPPALSMKMTNNPDPKIYPGQIMTYDIKPIAGIPMRWMTEITHVKEFRFFVDNQLVGPYAIWHHQHHFEPKDNGVEMTDIVHYKIPMGILGILAHKLFVRKKIKQIFEFRTIAINKLFGQMN